MERAFKKFLNMDDEKEGNVTFDQFIELFNAEPTGETKKVGGASPVGCCHCGCFRLLLSVAVAVVVTGS